MRKKHITFIEHIRDISGLSLSAIARQAKLADTTLTRFMNKPELDSLSAQTLDKVAQIGGYIDYEDFLMMNKAAGSNIKADKIKISDAQKFEIYEIVRKLLEKKSKKPANPNECGTLTSEVINHMHLLNTDFVTESLVMYVIEKTKNL